MTSLAEDVKLSACGRHPSSFLHVDFVCLFLFFRLSVCHPSLGEFSLTTYLTCDIPLVLYFWAHWGHCAILVWG
jgi:hypothetical protein